ncbi:MAG: ribonuclease III [Candidatus Bathyarchaeota archaeon]|nr:ribonuclease III [Candidatus Bathyarchaeota archaeon]
MEKILGVHFKDKSLLQEALIHRSYLNEHPDCSLQHNERLEFLGDSVLELLVSEHLYKEFKKPEGEMTNLRAALVNTDILGKVAKELKIGNYLCLSKGEARDTGRARIALLANTLEAIIGAIYLDQGLEKTRQFVEKNILNALPGVLKKKIIKDPKTQFQEMVQEKLRITPHYEVLQEWGPDHERRFLVGLYLDKRVIAKGEGFSKQEAEEKAAYEALKTMENKQSERLE